MANSGGNPIFLDTSVQIARLVHGPMTKRRIRERIAQHDRAVTGLIVRQEFKRRLLKEAQYLLTQLDHYKSFAEVYQHVVRLPDQWPRTKRKRNICLQTLGQVHGGTDRDRTDRLRLYLRSLLINGLRQFRRSVDHVIPDSGCGCSKHDIVEKEPFRKYNLGEERCSRTKQGECAIVAFLESRREDAVRILKKLETLPEDHKSSEIKNAEQFLKRIFGNENRARNEDPCLTVGDLMIALESVGISSFFTLNGAESQHLCRALDQNLTVRPIDPLKEDVVCARENTEWPKFGRSASPQ
jgi:hypothetical protein